MKFGKHLKAAVVEGWVYLDYKGLKKLVKELQGLPAFSVDPRRGAAEKQFMEELWNGIAQVNAFFIDKERSLLAELQRRSSDDDSRAKLYDQVSDLRSHAILNYLAVLKIAKKHDKHSEMPLRQRAVDHMWGQAFYLSLEHSYLFAECKQHLEADIDAKLVLYAEAEARTADGGLRPRMWRRSPAQSTAPPPQLPQQIEGKLEVPAHFERGLVTGRRQPLYDLPPGARAGAREQSPVNLEISRILGLAGSKYALPASPTPTRIDGVPLCESSSADELGRAGHAWLACHRLAPGTASPARSGGSFSAGSAGVNALEEDMMFDMSEFES